MLYTQLDVGGDFGILEWRTQAGKDHQRTPARVPGSGLNGHKWQTNSDVGSASTKVEMSRVDKDWPWFCGLKLFRFYATIPS